MQAICRNCINAKIDGNPMLAINYLCKKHPIPKTKDYVTGCEGYYLANMIERSEDRAYRYCDRYNRKGECKDFRLDLIERVKK